MNRLYRVASLVLLAASAASCALFISFDDYEEKKATDGARYEVSGRVEGLGADETVTVSLNGGSPQERRGDGPFSFGRVLIDGADYTITVTDSKSHTCAVDVGGKGKVAGADVNVSIRCLSNDPSLLSLSVDGGSLTPDFAPQTTGYSVKVPRILPLQSTTVTASFREGAQLLVGDAGLASGTVSAPIPLFPPAPTRINLLVTAPDRKTQRLYSVDVSEHEGDYLKASNTREDAVFGFSVALSGNTLVVGANGESSNATGVNGNQADTSAASAGAVYVFTRTGTVWTQQAYIKASNARADAFFGSSVALSGDTLVVGAFGDSSNATGVNGNQADTSAASSGAVYVFTRTGAVWSQQAYIKASNTRALGFAARFGSSVALVGDTLAVGAPGESSKSTGVNGDQADNTATGAGAAYVFTRTGTAWSQQAYVKASNTHLNAGFGSSVALVGDTLVVGSPYESSNATGVNGNQTSIPAFFGAGAAYVFTRTGVGWSQQAYIKASNTQGGALFGWSVALSGETLAVGAQKESGNATEAGAAYVFTRAGSAWSQQAYVKASNPRLTAFFGTSVALSGDTLVVGSRDESSKATGVNGDQSNSSAVGAGAAYVFTRVGSAWSQQAYVKASNTRPAALFGGSVAFSEGTLAVGSIGEVSSATGVNGQGTPSMQGAGAVYLYR